MQRLRREMMMEISQVPRLPKSAMPAKRKEATRHLKIPKLATLQNSLEARQHYIYGGRSRTVADTCGRLRTVANGCEHKSGVERTHLNPQTSKVEREPWFCLWSLFGILITSTEAKIQVSVNLEGRRKHKALLLCTDFQL